MARYEPAVQLPTSWLHDNDPNWQPDEDGEDEYTYLPAKFEVCDNCRGKGTTVNPSIDGNGLSQEDFDEAGPDFYEDYMSGVYDVACSECGGDRVVPVPDDDRWTDEQKAAWERYQTFLANECHEDYLWRKYEW